MNRFQFSVYSNQSGCFNYDGENDLGFVYTAVKNGVVLIKHEGKLATTLRGSKAVAFAKKVDSLNFEQQQQYMARLTGNYKHGNERLAKNHLKNRKRYG